MKKQILPMLSAFAFIATTSIATAEDNVMNDHTAAYIEMQAASGQTNAFAEFLASAAPMVKETEPGTELWFALQAVTHLPSSTSSSTRRHGMLIFPASWPVP